MTDYINLVLTQMFTQDDLDAACAQPETRKIAEIRPLPDDVQRVADVILPRTCTICRQPVKDSWCACTI